MDTLISLGVVFGTAALIVLLWMGCLFVYYMIKFMRQLKETQKQMAGIREVMDDVILMYVEIAHGMLFAYEKFTHRFICQAKTPEELLNLASQLNPEKYIVISKKDLTEDAK